MKSIKYRGKEAVLVGEHASKNKDWMVLTFLQKYDFGLRVVKMDYDSTFGEMKIKELLICNTDLDAIELFRNNHIDAEEFAERIQLAQ